MRVYFNKNKVKQGKIICKWFIITYLRSYFTLFHYFTLKDKYGWLIRMVWVIKKAKGSL